MSEEIVVSILSRLPPKSVMRFKCVRKSWYSLIINSSFVAKHLSNTMRNKHSTSILCKRFVLRDINTDEKEVVCSLITFSNDSNGDEHNIVEDIQIPLSFGVTTRGHFEGIEILGAVCIIGHCNGIICLASGNIVLWNPAIREFKILPKHCLPDGTINSMGFGYDPKSEDYKFLNIVDPTAEALGERIVYHLPRVEVYTLSTDSWREIMPYCLETETTIFCPMFYQMYFKGFCYWIGYEQQKEFMESFDRDDEEWVRQVILSFDMSNEVFDHILLPNSLYEPMARYFYMHVILWNESVALFGLYCIGGPDAYGVWVLNNFGTVKGSWTKLLTLEVILGIEKELVFWKSDEILMVAKDGRIVSYNFKTQKIKYLPIESMFPDNPEAVICVNSIVPVIHEKLHITLEV